MEIITEEDKLTTKSLDELLDKITEGNKHEEQIADMQGKELI